MEQMDLPQSHAPRCDCGCTPSMPSLFEMAAMRAERRRQRQRGDALSNGYPGEAQEDASGATEALQKLQLLQKERQHLKQDLHQQRLLRAAMLALHEPTAVEAERLVQISSTQFRVKQDPALAQGGLLWSSGILLARFLAARGLKEIMQREAAPAVLELGCGVAALPSLVAAAIFGASVCATDLPEVMDLANANVRENAARLGLADLSSLKLLAFDWTSEVSLGCFDLILAADLLYDAGLQDPLVKCLVRSVAENGRAIFAFQEREASVERRFFDALRGHGFKVKALEIPTDMVEDLPQKELRLWEVQRCSGPASIAVGEETSLDNGLYL